MMNTKGRMTNASVSIKRNQWPLPLWSRFIDVIVPGLHWICRWLSLKFTAVVFFVDSKGRMMGALMVIGASARPIT